VVGPVSLRQECTFSRGKGRSLLRHPNFERWAQSPHRDALKWSHPRSLEVVPPADTLYLLHACV
jgi:hypothetical protein